MKYGLRRIISFFLCAVTLSMLLLGCSENRDDQTADLPDLVIGSGIFTPYFYLDETGHYTGIDVDIATEACRRIGYEPVFKEITWTEKDTLLDEGSVDCLWACFSMNGREDLFQWAGPYAYDRQVVAVLSGSTIQTLADLEDKKVAVQMNSKPQQFFLDRLGDHIPEVKTIFSLYDIDEIVSALRREYVDACAGHEAALLHALDEAGVSYRLLEEPLLISQTGVAFSLDHNSGVCQKLDAALEQMRQDGTIARILLSYGLGTGGA